MLVRSLAFLFLIGTSLPVLADNFLTELINAPKYKWISLGYSQDLQETGTRGVVLSGGLFPEETGFGFQSYLEATKLDDPKDDGMVYTLGIEPVIKWKWAYLGLGMSVSDRTTAVSGTYWTFHQSLGGRWKPKNEDWFLDLSVRHRSHCARCGIEEDKVNTGMTSLNLQFGLAF